MTRSPHLRLVAERGPRPPDIRAARRAALAPIRAAIRGWNRADDQGVWQRLSQGEALLQSLPADLRAEAELLLDPLRATLNTEF